MQQLFWSYRPHVFREVTGQVYTGYCFSYYIQCVSCGSAILHAPPCNSLPFCAAEIQIPEVHDYRILTERISQRLCLQRRGSQATGEQLGYRDHLLLFIPLCTT